MKTILAILLGIVTVGALCVGSHTADSAPAPAARSASAWEYGDLSYRWVSNPALVQAMPFPGAPVGPAPPAPPAPVKPGWMVARWVTVERAVEAKGWDGLATVLKAPPAPKAGPKDTDRLRAFNQLGAEGWELADYQQGRGGLDADVYLFKRRVGK